MKTEVKIIAPEGYEIDKENSTFECVKFKKKERLLPKKYKELITVNGYYIGVESNIVSITQAVPSNSNKDIFPTKELAEAALALAQLLQLRDVYNDGWVADWSDDTCIKYSICCNRGRIDAATQYLISSPMGFKSAKIRDEFMINFSDLLEIAKPLL